MAVDNITIGGRNWFQIALQYAWLLAGFVLLALGVDMLRIAHLGLPPWNVLDQGVAVRTGLSFGWASVLVGLVMMVLSAALGEPPRLATVLNMTVVGLLTDAIPAWGWLPDPEAVPPGAPLGFRLAYGLGGVVVLGIGIGWYIAANLGAGPRDSLMLALTRRTRRPIGSVRTALEVAALLLGWMLGGEVGIGTLLTAVTIGWVVQGSLWVFNRLPFSFGFEVPSRPGPATARAGEPPASRTRATVS
ncbi:MAG TPA: hypothetical protein VIK92_06125 [Thermaerobacter sp.]